MKIVLLISSFNVGGTERQLSLLASGLKQMGHSVTVLIYYAGGKLESSIIDQGIDCIVLNKKGRWDILTFLFKLIMTIRSIRPDVVYSFLNGPNLLSALIFPFIRKVPIVWGIRGSGVDFTKVHWLHRLSFKAAAMLSGVPKIKIANSYAGKEHFISHGYSSKNFLVINNGIDTDRFCIDSQMRTEQRKKWSISEDQYLVGMVARIHPSKDHELFVRTARLLTNERPDLVFACIGDGDPILKDNLYSLVEELGLKDKFIWHAQNENINALYNAFDVNVLLSKAGEGFPNSVVEGMSCGVVTVAMNVGDVPNIIKDEKLLVANKTAEGVCEALTYAISMCRDVKIKQDVRDTIVTRYKLDKMVSDTESALKTILRER